LMRGDGLIGELLALLGVLQCGVVAGHGCADGSPADAVARLVEATERAFEAGDAGEKVLFGDFAIGEGKTRGNGGAQRPFAMNVPGLETLGALLDEKAADFVVFTFGPDHGDVGDGAGGDPHFFAVEDVAAAFFDGTGEHAAGVRAELRLGEAKAAYG